ncbi:MAG: TonB-dependent receptor [Muribaculaceae bacterium]|nr:TonB-dependent receptor [Muribaculaceae bacterium]
MLLTVVPAGATVNDVCETAVDTLVALPQVSVTAVKIGSRLYERPLASTVITSGDITIQGIDNLHLISDLAPNLYMPRYGSRITSSIYMRGIGARIDQPAIGLTIDNIPVLNKDNYDFDIDDMVRVDVLRGPQSSLYGRNTMSGLINVSTLSPMQFNGIKARVEGGSYGNYKASVGGYYTFSDNFSGAVGGTASWFDGYYKNEYNGTKVGAERQLSAWYKLAWYPTSEWRVENTGRAYRNRQHGYPYESLTSGKIAYNDTCFYRRDSWLDGLTVAWHRGPLSFTSVTSVQHINDNMTLDQDFLPESYFTLTQRRHETSVTQDLILKHNSPDSHYSWLAGIFGFTRHTSMKAPVTFLPVGIERLIEANRNEANPHYPIKWDEDRFVLNSDFSHPTRGLGIYHNSEYRHGNFTFSGSLRLEIENPQLRFNNYTDTKYTIYNNTDPLHPTVYRHETVNLDIVDKLSSTYVELLPRLSVMYRVQPTGGNIYVSIAKGYKPGGFNTQMFSDFLQQKLMETMGMSQLYDVDEIVGYDPERSYNYEAGTHLSFLDGNLNIDGCVFYIDCRDQQLTRFPAGTTTGRVMDNAGRTRSMGAELTVRYAITPRWKFNASWGHADARFVDYNDGRDDYSGNFVPYAPLNTSYLGLSYHNSFPAAHIENFEILLSAKGTGPIYWNEDNSRRQDFYMPVAVTVSATSGIFTLRAWADNILNTHFDTFYFKSMGNEFVQRGAPFTAGVSLSLDIDLMNQ